MQIAKLVELGGTLLIIIIALPALMLQWGFSNDDVRDYVEALTPAPYEVTQREAEVARLVSWHFENPEVAEHLRISINTAKAHVGRLLLKLQCESRGVLAGEVRRIVREFQDAKERRLRAATTSLALVGRKKAPPVGRVANGRSARASNA